MKVFICLLAALCVCSAENVGYGQSNAPAERTDTGSSSQENIHGNPANVIFRTIQAASGERRFFSAPAPQQQVHTNYAPALVEPVVIPAPVVRQEISSYSEPLPKVSVVRTSSEEEEPYDANPQYSFEYNVDDAAFSDHHAHKESRQNGEVVGEYRILDPNGDLRITKYRAGADGYTAEVTIQQGAGPVWVSKQQPAAQLQFARPAPIPIAVQQQKRQEVDSSRFVNANVLNLGSASRNSFFNAPAPIRQQQRGGFYVLQAPTTRFVAVRNNGASNGGNGYGQQYQPAPQQRASAYVSGNSGSFTRIVHSDGTTTEY